MAICVNTPISAAGGGGLDINNLPKISYSLDYRGTDSSNNKSELKAIAGNYYMYAIPKSYSSKYINCDVFIAKKGGSNRGTTFIGNYLYYANPIVADANNNFYAPIKSSYNDDTSTGLIYKFSFNESSGAGTIENVHSGSGDKFTDLFYVQSGSYSDKTRFCYVDHQNKCTYTYSDNTLYRKDHNNMVPSKVTMLSKAMPTINDAYYDTSKDIQSVDIPGVYGNCLFLVKIFPHKNVSDSRLRYLYIFNMTTKTISCSKFFYDSDTYAYSKDGLIKYIFSEENGSVYLYTAEKSSDAKTVYYNRYKMDTSTGTFLEKTCICTTPLIITTDSSGVKHYPPLPVHICKHNGKYYPICFMTGGEYGTFILTQNGLMSVETNSIKYHFGNNMPAYANYYKINVPEKVLYYGDSWFITNTGAKFTVTN